MRHERNFPLRLWAAVPFSAFLCLFLPLVLCVGCGDDGSGPGDGGAVDSGASDCSTASEGAACGEDRVCIAGACVASRCGDGFANSSAGEECDDGNDISGDGCEPSTCFFTCSLDVLCDDGAACNGTETCNTGTRTCVAGVLPPNDTACELEGGAEGTCAATLCRPAGCGDGEINGEEECDDGNSDNLDGCKSDCTFTCSADSECDDGNACSGAETCDITTHVCTEADDLDCDDSDTCTADSCDMDDGCVNELIDADGDGFAPGTCTTPGLDGGDCDEMNNTVYPGAPEQCNGIDNDCDGTPDNDVTEIMCLRDGDGDGFGRADDPVSACSCPAGTVPPRGGGVDCQDALSDVSPAQTLYSAVPYCPRIGGLCTDRAELTFDYNCDGDETQEYTITSLTNCGTSVGGSCRRAGWEGDAAPACGELGMLRTCRFMIAGGLSTCGEASFAEVRQPCR